MGRLPRVELLITPSFYHQPAPGPIFALSSYQHALANDFVRQTDAFGKVLGLSENRGAIWETTPDRLGQYCVANHISAFRYTRSLSIVGQLAPFA